MRDVVVVVLDLSKRFLVGFHQALDVRVFSLLDARRFRLARRVQAFPYLRLVFVRYDAGMLGADSPGISSDGGRVVEGRRELVVIYCKFWGRQSVDLACQSLPCSSVGPRTEE